MSNKYSQKRLHSAKKYTIHATKTTSRRAIQKTGEATGDLIRNKIADKRTSISNSSQNDEANNEMEIPNERYISP